MVKTGSGVQYHSPLKPVVRGGNRNRKPTQPNKELKYTKTKGATALVTDTVDNIAVNLVTKKTIGYINLTGVTLVIKERSGEQLVVKQYEGRSLNGIPDEMYNCLIRVTSYTVTYGEALDQLDRLSATVSVLDELETYDVSGLSYYYKALSAAVTRSNNGYEEYGRPNGTPLPDETISFNTYVYITPNELFDLEASGEVSRRMSEECYSHALDVLIGPVNAPERAHPFARQIETQHYVEGRMDKKITAIHDLDLIDNHNYLSERHYVMFGEVHTIKAKRDTRKEDGLHITKSVLHPSAVQNERVTEYDVHKDVVPLDKLHERGFFATREEALNHLADRVNPEVRVAETKVKTATSQHQSQIETARSKEKEAQIKIEELKIKLENERKDRIRKEKADKKQAKRRRKEKREDAERKAKERAEERKDAERKVRNDTYMQYIKMVAAVAATAGVVFKLKK